jgi:transposase
MRRREQLTYRGENLYTYKQVAERLAVSLSKVKKLVAEGAKRGGDGFYPIVRIGGRPRLTEAVIVDYLKRHRIVRKRKVTGI